MSNHPLPFGIDPEKLYTTTEAAELRRSKVAALESERARGVGPRFVKNGRLVLYPGQYLIEWFESRTVNSTRRFGTCRDEA